MERNANYTLVGGLALLLLIGLVAFVVWLAQVSFARQYDLYDVVFIGPVRGLTEGGEVHFNGIKVGEVTKISLDKRDANRVIARARLSADVPVRVDSYATLEPLGITGVNYVQITAGTPSKALLRDQYKGDEVPILRSQRGAIQDLLEGGGTVLSRTVDALDRVNRLLSDQNLQSFGGTMADLKAISGDVRTQTAQLNQAQLIQKLDATVGNLNATIQQVDGLATDVRGVVNGDAKRTLATVADTADELKATATDLRGAVSGLRGPADDFATTGLPQLTQAVVTLQQSAESLDRLVGELERSPRSLLQKAPTKQLEVAP